VIFACFGAATLDAFAQALQTEQLH